MAKQTKVEIPANKHWIYKNPKAVTSLMRGIEDAKSGRIVDVCIDFSKFLDEKDIVVCVKSS